MPNRRVNQEIFMRSGVGWVPAYLLQDDFITDQPAPLVTPRTCEPGPGVLLLTDTSNNASIVGGNLHFLIGGVGWGDPGAWDQAARTRVVGRAVYTRINSPAVGNCHFGFDGDQAGSIATGNALALVGSSLRAYDTASGPVLQTVAAGWSEFMTILTTPSGAWHLMKGNGWADWTLLWPSQTNATSPLYPAIAKSSGIWDIDRFRVVDLPAPWNAPYGIITSRIAAAGAGATSISEANAIVEAIWQVAAGAVYELSIRRTDDDNRWIIRCDQAGGTVKIIERNGGGETERASAALVWTVGANQRIVPIFYGNTIDVVVNSSYRCSYNLAAFNNTATGVMTSHAVTNLIAWPRQISGVPLTLLNRVAA